MIIDGAWRDDILIITESFVFVTVYKGSADMVRMGVRRCSTCGEYFDNVPAGELMVIGWQCVGCRGETGRVSVREHDVTCAVCGAGTVATRSDKRYCTPRCQARAWRANHPRPKSQRDCAWCGSSLAGRRYDARFCSVKCRVSSWRAGRSEAGLKHRRVTDKR
jgi:hypothetical protein